MRLSRASRIAVAAVMLGLVAGTAAASPPPPACRIVQHGAPLQQLLDEASAGSALCLEAGDWPGPLRISTAVTLWGPRSAIVRSARSGTTIRLDAPHSALVGITVDGSGGRFDQLDAAVRIHGDDVRVEGVRVENALFGILVEQVHRAELIDNEVTGPADSPLGMRGDGIRLWEVRGSRVEGNRIEHSRDLVVWYSPGNVFRHNRVVDGRYGTHFMYSHDNRVEENEYRRNVVGIFAMYSRNLTLRGNLLAEAGGAAGVGVGCKESGNLRIEENRLIGNTTGLYLDTCPLYLDERNTYAGNLFQFSDAAVVLHGSEKRNHFTHNAFRGNRSPLRIEGRSDGRGVRWSENYFDEYAGYDLDDDDFGDIPFELRSVEGELTQRFPVLAFFRGSAAMALAEATAKIIPLFQPQLLLRDPRPRMHPEPDDAN